MYWFIAQLESVGTIYFLWINFQYLYLEFSRLHFSASTMCIAYLMFHKELNLESAHRWVKERRPVIHPNRGFWEHLFRLEMSLFSQKNLTFDPELSRYKLIIIIRN